MNAASYNLLAFLQIVLANIALNQAWTALYIMLIVAMPVASFNVSSAVASVFSFTSGFYIPVEQLGWWYVYIAKNLDIHCRLMKGCLSMIILTLIN